MEMVDYKYKIKAALQVFRNKRTALYDDTIKIKPDLFLGLHESQHQAEREVYIQYYETIWLSEHWNDFAEILESNRDLRDWDKKELTVFFSEHFSRLIDSCTESGLMSKLAIPDLLDIQKQQLRELITYSEKWEENSNVLKLQTKKSKESFRLLKEEAERRKDVLV